MWTRRQILAAGGGSLATLAAPGLVRAAGTEVIAMSGTSRGEHVWFWPQGLAVSPGTTLRFANRDPGNSHRATAHHPDLFDRLRRVPEGATPWDSGFLLPDETFEVTLEEPGVYDYYCQLLSAARDGGHGRPDRGGEARRCELGGCLG